MSENPLAKTQELINAVRAAADDTEMAHIEEDRLASYVIECVAKRTFDSATLRAMATMAFAVLSENRPRWYS